MYSIFFNYSLWIKIWQSLLCLLLRYYIVLHRSESPVHGRCIYSVLQDLPILRHWSISTSLQCPLIESFTAKLVLVGARVVATVRLATQAQHFCTAKFFIKQSGFAIVVYVLQQVPGICNVWLRKFVKVISSSVWICLNENSKQSNESTTMHNQKTIKYT